MGVLTSWLGAAKISRMNMNVQVRASQGRFRHRRALEEAPLLGSTGGKVRASREGGPGLAMCVKGVKGVKGEKRGAAWPPCRLPPRSCTRHPGDTPGLWSRHDRLKAPTGHRQWLVTLCAHPSYFVGRAGGLQINETASVPRPMICPKTTAVSMRTVRRHWNAEGALKPSSSSQLLATQKPESDVSTRALQSAKWPRLCPRRFFYTTSLISARHESYVVSGILGFGQPM
ncbi:uncharacterized protein B0H64DRAFT_239406 [Chaetomium fimeti]|uniref:Uncharacterized protein n=1 Tax=Chaetomium fimeti TaxID=1854472 RepID=A0AAE0H8B4_9PEZI|nr:hypothetical protein B0H64DRAFT_239406 [Chaetomium fimeti]